jgi:FKBP-type peptidyl-prolyl cis-trans isomerase FklB
MSFPNSLFKLYFCASLWDQKFKLMKKIFLAVLACSIILSANAQKTNTKQVPPKPAVNPMKNLNDSASYAIGLSVVNFYKQQGMTKLNATLVTKAINDILNNKKPLFSDSTANVVMNKCLNSLQEEKTKPNIQAGIDFLKQNKTRPGVITTASGLQYEIVTEGAGEKPGPRDSVTCHYIGTLLDGTPFDNSYDRGQPITFALNKVIAGWTEGLQLMGVGSKYILYIPHELGYGTFDYGPIPGGSTLKFEIELLAVKKAM